MQLGNKTGESRKKYVLPVLVDVGVGSCATRKIGLLRGPFKRLILKPWPNVATPPPLRER